MSVLPASERPRKASKGLETEGIWPRRLRMQASTVSLIRGFAQNTGLGEASKGFETEGIRLRTASNVGFERIS